MSSTNPPDLPESKWAKSYPKDELPAVDTQETPERAKKEYELDGNPFGDNVKRMKARKNDKS